jgi:peptidoglycan-N-acetylmuramic acid deacetylase
MTDERYADLSNEPMSWWYRVPEPLYEGVRAGIDDDIAALISKYDGIWQRPAGKKQVYITMDEGYEMEGATPLILDTAKEKDFKIHFFITAGYMEEEGVAGYIEEINGANETFRNLTGEDFAPFFRPPEGGYSERALAVARDLGYYDVFWSFAYRDWVADEQPDPDEAMDKIMGQLHDGSVLLLHANSRTNAQILGELVDRIRAEGYTIGSLLDELDEIEGRTSSAAGDSEPQPGEIETPETPVVTTAETVAETETQPPETTAEVEDSSYEESPAEEVPQEDSSSDDALSSGTYVVKENDTLWDIATNLYPSEDPIDMMTAIAAANGEDSYEEMYIFEGEPIQLP